MKVHCLFEQSGTFKNEFRSLGYEAYDYDICNDFGQTDFKIDLFAEILRGGHGEHSIFDEFSKDDLIMAFFPCIRFEQQILFRFRGQSYEMKEWTPAMKMRKCMQLMDELRDMYQLVNYLFLICIEKGLRLVVENPYSEEHFLRRYWCYAPAVIDMDRRDDGDYYKKPTQYWFVNFEPKNNLLFEAIPYNTIEVKNANNRITKEHWGKMGAPNLKVARSMIHPMYANRFIRKYLIEEEQLEKHDET